MFLLIILFLFSVYINFGLLILFQIIIWTIVFLLSNLLIGINPFSLQFHVIRLLSICAIVFILWYNTRDIVISTALLLPFSTNQISFVEELEKLSVDSTLMSENFYDLNINETSKFLSKLDVDSNYIVNMEFIADISLLGSDINVPRMLLTRPFIINKDSSALILTKFFYEQLNLMVDCYYLDDTILHDMKDRIGPVIILKYAKFYCSFSI